MFAKLLCSCEGDRALIRSCVFLYTCSLSNLWKRDLNSEAADLPGSGAAGGLGGGLLAFCGARLASGFDIIAQQMHLESAISDSDLVITGVLGLFTRGAFFRFVFD